MWGSSTWIMVDKDVRRIEMNFVGSLQWCESTRWTAASCWKKMLPSFHDEASLNKIRYVHFALEYCWHFVFCIYRKSKLEIVLLAATICASWKIVHLNCISSTSTCSLLYDPQWTQWHLVTNCNQTYCTWPVWVSLPFWRMVTISSNSWLQTIKIRQYFEKTLILYLFESVTNP